MKTQVTIVLTTDSNTRDEAKENLTKMLKEIVKNAKWGFINGKHFRPEGVFKIAKTELNPA